ncbi:hypothetical protein MTF68_05160 [Pseudoalteromonas sp. 2CM37A]|uniref:hypothetical protein n=1 Tax=Pseudoalteromonas sp. 2CM37A TaxID=2929853 RepID=UPI0020BFB842|nr:hypothetical protein [Pseudoalteromonas sp. 2CM37A]MCK8116941.1 hypothetical protein [Pseudoalteromonas sp. 2CM37A]
MRNFKIFISFIFLFFSISEYAIASELINLDNIVCKKSVVCSRNEKFNEFVQENNRKPFGTHTLYVSKYFKERFRMGSPSASEEYGGIDLVEPINFSLRIIGDGNVELFFINGLEITKKAGTNNTPTLYTEDLKLGALNGALVRLKSANYNSINTKFGRRHDSCITISGSTTISLKRPSFYNCLAAIKNANNETVNYASIKIDEAVAAFDDSTFSFNSSFFDINIVNENSRSEFSIENSHLYRYEDISRKYGYVSLNNFSKILFDSNYLEGFDQAYALSGKNNKNIIIKRNLFTCGNADEYKRNKYFVDLINTQALSVEKNTVNCISPQNFQATRNDSINDKIMFISINEVKEQPNTKFNSVVSWEGRYTNIDLIPKPELKMCLFGSGNTSYELEPSSWICDYYTKKYNYVTFKASIKNAKNCYRILSNGATEYRDAETVVKSIRVTGDIETSWQCQGYDGLIISDTAKMDVISTINQEDIQMLPTQIRDGEYYFDANKSIDFSFVSKDIDNCSASLGGQRVNMYKRSNIFSGSFSNLTPSENKQSLTINCNDKSGRIQRVSQDLYIWENKPEINMCMFKLSNSTINSSNPQNWACDISANNYSTVKFKSDIKYAFSCSRKASSGQIIKNLEPKTEVNVRLTGDFTTNRTCTGLLGNEATKVLSLRAL